MSPTLRYYKGVNEIAYFLYIYYEIKALEFHEIINDIEECSDPKIVQKIVDKQLLNVDINNNFNPNETISGREIIEISEKGYYIPDEEHMIYKAATIAGGDVVTKDVNLLSTVVEHQIKVGEEFMLKHGALCHAYFSITGSNYMGASLISISQKQGFKELQVLQKDQVYNLSSELVGKYTFRYLKGIKEFHRLMYKEDSVVKSFDRDKLNEPLTRLSFTQSIYDFYTLQTYVNEDQHYYEFPHYLHTYGAFRDVKFNQPWYDVIETVTMKGWLTNELFI